MALGVPREEREMEGHSVAVEADEMEEVVVSEEIGEAESIGEAEKDAEPDNVDVVVMVKAIERVLLAEAVLKLDTSAEAVNDNWEDLEVDEVAEARADAWALLEGEAESDITILEMPELLGVAEVETVPMID